MATGQCQNSLDFFAIGLDKVIGTADFSEIERTGRTPAELWTACYTPRELRLLARLTGLRVDAVWGVTPGDYSPRPPSTETPEHLLVATKVR